jgi:phosphatidylglycerophosphate synthase
MSHQKTWEIGLPVPLKYIGNADKIFYYLSYKLGSYVNNFGISPNMITLFGLCCNLITAMSIVHNKKYYIITIFLGTLSDTMDGFNARRYDRVSKYGALIDHGADWVSAIAIIIASIVRWGQNLYFYLIFSGIMYLEIMNLRYSGFVQEYQGKPDVFLSTMFQHNAGHKMLESKLIQYKEYCSSLISLILIPTFYVLQIIM